MSLLSLGLSDKYIRMWKFSKKEGSEDLEFHGLKLDVSIHNDDVISKSKI
jgi:hypothetical protein